MDLLPPRISAADLQLLSAILVAPVVGASGLRLRLIRESVSFQRLIQRRAGPSLHARNHLLFHALDDEDWVQWLDVDVISYLEDIIEQLLSIGHDIVHPHCVTAPGGPSFDLNAWRDRGRQRMQDLRGQGRVRLDAVGGTMLLVRADRHRDGLIFPPFFYGSRSRWVRDQHPLLRGECRRRDRDGRVRHHGQGHGDRVLGPARP